MIEPGHPDLSFGRQCLLLSISRSSFHCMPKGESETNLMPMRQSDEQFLETPFFGEQLGVRSNPSASTSTPGNPDRRPGPASESGWISITGSDRIQPLAASRLPWSIGSAKNKINPISRCREALNLRPNLSNDRGVAQTVL
ncbi:MAG: hypothetical protein RDA78_22455 [Roseibium sp.]